MPLLAGVLVPSPQVITVEVMSFSGSVQFPIAVTVSGALPLLGETESVQLGGWFAGAVTFTLLEAESPRPPESVAVTVTVKFPAVV